MKKILKNVIAILAFTTIALVSTVAEASYSRGNVDTNPAESIGDNFWRLNGDVEDGNMKEVWFAFSKSDKTPSCNSSAQREKKDGGSNRKGKTFYANVSFLDDDSTYYFKACGLDRNGEITSGRILNFEIGNSKDMEEKNANLEIKTFPVVEHTANSAKLKGVVSGANNVSAWFVISGKERSPECNVLKQTERVNGTVAKGKAFFKRVNLLESNTTYNFRACAKNFSGKIFSGNIERFATDRVDYNLMAKVSTEDVKKVGYNFAELNGRVIINGTQEGNTYFRYGKDKGNLYLKTSSLKTELDIYFQAGVRLEHNTKYYFQSVVEDENNDIVSKGEIKSFRTKSTKGKRISNSSEIIEETTVMKYVNKSSFNDLIFKKTVSRSHNKNFGLKVDVSSGDYLYYKLRFVNNSDKKINNFNFTDVIPEGIEVVELNKGANYNRITRKVTWNIDELSSQESEIFILKMKVQKGLNAKTIVSTTKIQSGKKVNETNSVRVFVSDDFTGTTVIDKGQGASIFNSNGPFSNIIFGGLVIIAIILFVVFIISRFFEIGKNSKQEIEDLERVEEDKMS